MAASKTKPDETAADKTEELSEGPGPEASTDATTATVDETPASNDVEVHTFANGYGAKTYTVHGEQRMVPLSPAGRVIRRLNGVEGVFPRSVTPDEIKNLLEQIAKV